jgi:23S rRNA (cytosine1962-C5)-methyltransferase
MEQNQLLASLAHIPGPAERHIALRVTPEAERALRQGHPWLFDQAICQQSHAGQSGDLAVIFDRKRRFVAIGLYDPLAPIRVRILQHGQPAAINQNWFESKLAAAAHLRTPLLALTPERITTGYRLVHGENDGLPGLVIDRYEQTLVLKLYTLAWLPHLANILAALTSVTSAERLILRLSRSMLAQPQALYGLSDGMILLGSPHDGPVLFWENGLRFEADLVHGQKTGFFLDQRDNRARVEKLAYGKTVLNVFAYTGGFSVYAARGGARHIISVDLSQPALQAAGRNLAHNQLTTQHEIMVEDAFAALARLAQTGRRFDLVIIDPPAFAQNKVQVAPALAAYQRLTKLGLAVLSPGGILIQASCSSRIDAETFFNTVNRAAAQAGRPLREFERTGHALDHPITFKEGAYLKCLLAIAP